MTKIGGITLENKKAQVVFLVGSASDLPALRDSAVDVFFRVIGITFRVHVISAHRNVVELSSLCASELDSGARFFICGAGMAAHLAGCVAALVHREASVLGVALTRPEHPDGSDAMSAMVNMPPGVPVAFMGTGKVGFMHAAQFAANILAEGSARVLLESYLDQRRKHPEYDINLDTVEIKK